MDSYSGTVSFPNYNVGFKRLRLNRKTNTTGNPFALNEIQVWLNDENILTSISANISSSSVNSSVIYPNDNYNTSTLLDGILSYTNPNSGNDGYNYFKSNTADINEYIDISFNDNYNYDDIQSIVLYNKNDTSNNLLGVELNYTMIMGIYYQITKLLQVMNIIDLMEINHILIMLVMNLLQI